MEDLFIYPWALVEIHSRNQNAVMKTIYSFAA